MVVLVIEKSSFCWDLVFLSGIDVAVAGTMCLVIIALCWSLDLVIFSSLAWNVVI